MNRFNPGGLLTEEFRLGVTKLFAYSGDTPDRSSGTLHPADRPTVSESVCITSAVINYSCYMPSRLGGERQKTNRFSQNFLPKPIQSILEFQFVSRSVIVTILGDCDERGGSRDFAVRHTYHTMHKALLARQWGREKHLEGF